MKAFKSIMLIIVNLKLNLSILLILIIGISSSSSCQENKQFNNEEFKKNVRTNITLTSQDSADALASKAGNIETYLVFRRKLIAGSIKSSSWERQSFVFNIPLQQLKKQAKVIGIDSAYYFYAFMADSLTEHPVKTEIISSIKKTLYDSLNVDVNKYSNRKLIDMYSGPRLRTRLKAQGEIIHQIQNEPTASLINEVFAVNIEKFAAENNLNLDDAVNLTLKKNQRNPLFEKLMEVSKENFLKILVKEKQEEVKNFEPLRYYLYVTNSYSFNKVGGYNLD